MEVTGFPGRPGPGVLEGNVVYDAIRNTGLFQCSHDLINRIHENLYQGIRGNYRTISTDCPQRDERHGWLGDRGEQTRGESSLRCRRAPWFSVHSPPARAVEDYRAKLRYGGR